MWERWNRQKRPGESSSSEGPPTGEWQVRLGLSPAAQGASDALIRQSDPCAAATRAWPGKAHRPSQSAQEAERNSFDSDRTSSTSSGAERGSQGQTADLEALLSSRTVRCCSLRVQSLLAAPSAMRLVCPAVLEPYFLVHLSHDWHVDLLDSIG